MIKTGELISEMIKYDAGDVRRIPHFMKVYAYAKAIGEMEHIDERTQYILELAAITHDIGIKVSEEKYGNCSGPNQEKEGPPIAGELLDALGVKKNVIDRVCFLISKHHTYGTDFGIDHQILIEADFLVNSEEEHMSREQVIKTRERIFKTQTGIRFLNELYGIGSCGR